MKPLTVEFEAAKGTLTFDLLSLGVRAQLEGVRDVDAALSNRGRGVIKWFVNDMSANGIYRMAFVGKPRTGAPKALKNDAFVQRVTREYVEQIRHVADEQAVPPLLSMQTIEAIEDSAQKLAAADAVNIRAVDETSGQVGRIGEQERQVLHDLIMPAWSAAGSVTGRLETIGRRPRPYATVYEAKSGRGVRCEFGEALTDAVLGAWDRRVIASGTVFYNQENRITRLQIADLEVLPPDEELPRAADLFGRFPGLTYESMLERTGRG